MTAFGAPQGGKAKAPESKPKQGHKAGTSDAPRGEMKKPQTPRGIGGSRRGFGA